MKRISKDSSLHERTVQELAAGQLTPRPRRAGERRSRTVTVTVQVDIRVWRKARELAEGDNSRIEVESETSVVVHKTASWRTNR